jgi:hypothetical protein
MRVETRAAASGVLHPDVSEDDATENTRTTKVYPNQEELDSVDCVI